jgi:AcrR family transcriptional regulator
MRDIIKRAGFSQGTIYRYYANLDEIYTDFINKNTTYDSLEQRIEALLASAQSEKAILSECIIEIGGYVEGLLKSVGEKTCFELLVLYAYDNEKRKVIFPRLRFKQCLEYVQDKIVEYFISCVRQGVFHPTISMEAMITFIGISIDGITQHAAMSTVGDNGEDKEPTINVSEQFLLLSKAVVNFLES